MGETKSNWWTKIVIYGGFLIVGFVGVMVGNWFINWRNAEAKAQYAKKFERESNILLKKNDIFPEISLIDSDGQIVSFQNILKGHNTAIMFISPKCGPCTDAVDKWSTYFDKLPDDFQIIAISNDFLENTAEYLTARNFPYPFFCDTGFVLIKDYGINRYPSIMCLDEKMQIIEPYRSPYNNFSPLDAYELIKTSSNEPE